MIKEIREILVDKNKIEETVKTIAKKINADYMGESVTLLVVLKGSIAFATDLMRELNIDVTLDFIQTSSYGASTVSGELKIVKDMETDVEGKNIIIVEDIIDSGNTLKALMELLKKRGAKPQVCTFLSKPSRREVNVDVKYCGIEIPDEFVVGYGMDYNEKFRNLPYIGVLKKEVYCG